VDQCGVRPEQPARTREHCLGRIDPRDPIAAGGQLGRQQAGAAADVENVGDLLVVGVEKLVEELRQGVVARVNDDLVVDPCQPRVHVDRSHATRRRS
jgi:hypothetical protein